MRSLYRQTAPRPRLPLWSLPRRCEQKNHRFRVAFLYLSTFSLRRRRGGRRRLSRAADRPCRLERPRGCSAPSIGRDQEGWFGLSPARIVQLKGQVRRHERRPVFGLLITQIDEPLRSRLIISSLLGPFQPVRRVSPGVAWASSACAAPGESVPPEIPGTRLK
jgi:hypothetical protein